MPTFQLDVQEYEALVALARRGCLDAKGQVIADKARELDAFLRSIEKKSGIIRDILWVQWTEMDQQLPANTKFPNTWPPQQRKYIELVTRRVSRADVDAVIEAHAKKPLDILVTRDPGATLGWTPVASFFTTG